LRYTAASIEGVVLIDVEPIEDERGFFARSWDDEAFAANGLDTRVVQCNVSYNHRRGTLRGMHYQREPWPETKLVRCTRGGLYDVVIDLRAESPTYCRWEAFELTESNHRTLYIPAGVAHGFQTLTDATEVFYQMSERYRPEASAGVRWNDPAFGIAWPIADPILSPRDAAWADFQR
jgi:dTDP-4-dehydrorhamnose 3,5-epimerase